MNIDERIERRLRSNGDEPLIENYDAISPVSHVPEPNGREQVLERLLDGLDPAFTRGGKAPNVYVWGPKGSGKSAVITALFDRLDEIDRHQRSAIHTSTRATVPDLPSFVYVNGRYARSDFAILHAVIDAMSDERVPERGISTGELRDRLRERTVDRPGGSVVVAIDHLGEPGTCSVDELPSIFDFLEGSVSWVAVGNDPPSSVDNDYEYVVEFEPYGRHSLVDILSTRASMGLGQRAVSHDQVREIVEWADGDAHDALTALFGAAVSAEKRGRTSIGSADLDAGISTVPKPGVALGRVLSLSENRQRVLHELIALDDHARSSVDDATTDIASADGIDLSRTTIKRLLYELAEVGILERVTATESEGKGRPPSRVESRFPPLAFQHLSSYSD